MRRVFVAGSLESEQVRSAIEQACDDVGQLLKDEVVLASAETIFGFGDRNALITGSIRTADAVIADLSRPEARVFWELGVAQAFGRPTVLLAEDVGLFPQEMSGFFGVVYNRGSNSDDFLRARVASALAEILQESDAASVRVADAEKKTVFISYAHDDAPYLQRILVHLRPLERDGLIDLWSDSKIRAGDKWRDEIRKALDRAGTAILLVSADFLASDFILNDELPPLLTAAEQRGTRIVPIILKPSRYARDPRLSHYQALNEPSRPVIRMDEVEREELYAKVAELIELDLG